MYGRDYLDAMAEREEQRKARAIVDSIPQDLRERVRAAIAEDQEQARRVDEAIRRMEAYPGGLGAALRLAQMGRELPPYIFHARPRA